MKQRCGPAFALILTLVAIVMLTVTVVAFLGSVTIERRTANAYLNIAKADGIARAGLDAAISRLEEAVDRAKLTADGEIISYRDFLVYERTSADPTLSPILAMGKNTGKYGEDAVLSGITPLISTNSEPTSASAFDANFSSAFNSLERAREDKKTTINLNALGNALSRPANMGANEDSYFRAPAVEVKDADGKVVGRYAFIILDEQARLNPYHHRATDRNKSDAWGKSPEQIPFDTGKLGETPILLTKEEEEKVLSFPPLLMCTPYAVAHAFADRDRFEEFHNYLTGGATFDEDVIPAGLPEAGKPKYNLNDLATKDEFGSTPTERSTYIAEIIDRNLPKFKLRDTALQPESAQLQKRYLKRLAASIVDYIDEDSSITQTEDGEPAGRDLFPLVVATAERLRQTIATGSSRPIETQAFIQLWNPYTKPVEGKVKFRFFNRRKILFGEALETALQEYLPPEVEVSLQPNEMKVVKFDTTTQTFTSPAPVGLGIHPFWEPGFLGSEDGATNQAFELFWSPKNADGSFSPSLLVDMNRRAPVAPESSVGGLGRIAKILSDTLNYWVFNFLPTNKSEGGVYRFAGDPRGTYLSSYDWSYAIDITKPRWQGRQETISGRAQDYVTAWANREPTRANPNAGAPIGSALFPDEIATTYIPSSDGVNAPFYIKNGTMDSIGELGHIFDPAQADDQGFATPVDNHFASSGGRTLRIGYPEFEYWDKSADAGEKRAINLLDLFSVNVVENGFPREHGTININSAPAPVLQALFAGIQLTSDKGLTPAPALTPEGTAALAEEIVAQRPFAKLSDLRKILAKFSESAGSYDPPLPLPAGMMDRTREEAFAKSLQSISVRSHRFRIIVVGQNFDKRKQPAGQAILEAVVILSPDSAEPRSPLSAKICYLRHAN